MKIKGPENLWGKGLGDRTSFCRRATDTDARVRARDILEAARAGGGGWRRVEAGKEQSAGRSCPYSSDFMFQFAKGTLKGSSEGASRRGRSPI
jgi:hypothetical protein